MLFGRNHPVVIDFRTKWIGTTVFIIGGGASVNSYPLNLLEGKNIIGVNNAFSLKECEPQICWFGDQRWFEWNEAELKDYTGAIMTCHPQFQNRNDIITFLRGKPHGIDTSDSCVSWNLNSGGSAINLAWHLGAKRVVLIGFDMTVSGDGKGNYHDNHKRINPPDIYKGYLRIFPEIARDAANLNLEVINANPDSKLDIFPKVTAEESVLL